MISLGCGLDLSRLPLPPIPNPPTPWHIRTHKPTYRKAAAAAAQGPAPERSVRFAALTNPGHQIIYLDQNLLSRDAVARRVQALLKATNSG